MPKGDALQRLGQLVQLDQLLRNMHRYSHRGLLIASDTVLQPRPSNESPTEPISITSPLHK